MFIELTGQFCSKETFFCKQIKNQTETSIKFLCCNMAESLNDSPRKSFHSDLIFQKFEATWVE